MKLFNNATVLYAEVMANDFKKKETHYVPPRDFYSLSFRTKGEKSITVGGKTYISAAPCLTFVPKGCGYYTEIKEEGSMIAVSFDMSSEAENNNEIMVFSNMNNSVMKNLFSLLLEKYKIDNPKDYGCLSVFYEVLAVMENEINKNFAGNVSRRAMEIKNYIDKNFSDNSMSVDFLAEKYKVSQAYLRKEFKKAFDMSPISYINFVRFSNAKAMLKTGYYGVGEVAEKCGFSSLGYFSWAFHKEFGISPSEFIKQS